jgi:orotate phosphoribosyltransferase
MEKTINLLKETQAMLEGHFLLSSGLHSDRYFQCAKLLQHPDKAAAALAPVFENIRAAIASGTLAVDIIAGPAIGGIIVAYELGRQLGLPAIFTERVDDGKMALRRGFEIKAGQNILIAEDVVTTGKSSAESAAVLENLGGKIAALACIVDRRQENSALAWPLYAACKITASNWDATDCALCREGTPAVKPGSRKF